MRRLILLAALVTIIGCDTSRTRLKKPFVIVDKIAHTDFSELATFGYEDTNGNYNSFTDSIGLYHLGDTIR